jgi:hypothetical protein
MPFTRYAKDVERYNAIAREVIDLHGCEDRGSVRIYRIVVALLRVLFVAKIERE